MYPNLEIIHSRLDTAHRFRRQLLVAERLCTFVLGVAAPLLLFSLLAGYQEFPSLVRWLMLAALLFAVLFGASVCILRPLRIRWNREQIARCVEQHFPQLNNALINAVQLGAESRPRAPGIIDRLITETARNTTGYDFREAFSPQPAHRRASMAALAILLLALYGGLSPQRFQAGLSQILKPGAFVSLSGPVEIRVLPGNQTVFFGEDLTARAFLLASSRVPESFDAQIFTDLPRADASPSSSAAAMPSADSPHAMIRSKNLAFVYVFKNIQKPFRYWVMAGHDDTSPAYSVTVMRRPEVERIDATYEFPAYTHLQTRTEEDIPGPIKGVQGARVTLRVSIGPQEKKLAAAHFALASGAEAPKTEIAADGRSFQSTLLLETNDAFCIHLRDTEENSNKDPVQHSITVLPDAPPRVAITKPGKNITAAVGETLSLHLEAADDFGIADLFLLARVNESAVERLAGWQQFPNAALTRPTYDWYLDPNRYRPGDTVTYHAEAMDTNPRPGRASTGTFLLRLIDPAQSLADARKNLDEWEKELDAVLELQRDARSAAEQALQSAAEAAAADLQARSQPIHKTQVEIRSRTRDIAGRISSASSAAPHVLKALSWLVANPMAEAIQRLQFALARPEPAMAAEDLQGLLPVQDKIIAALEKILAILPKLKDAPPPASPSSEEGGDLPDDSLQDGLQQLAKNLEEFLKEQKKIIDASADLAKRPVDDFTNEQDAALRGLEAKEDRWSDFMKDTFSDFSKIPEQDFSNPSLLKEIIAVQSEIQMAKDALGQKAVEIATPLEEGGAELAEALTTHLEKWLPETPDREKWQMEEPLGEYQTPMAELPKELEDIIGNLLEAEEDLFEEMEDTSSSWADSMDKGAGWDAADGPISNMSAQGVTGNRLPNSSEIGGRSGEGRTGKSSGEFVEETASGLGGRRTPTRLTPDPFESGSVKDTSPEAGGGSTGGGKESGAGSEGLEGPSPDKHAREIKALSQQQAELRNRAEKIKLQLQVTRYPALFEETVQNMRALEDDLQSGRYQDAFRRRAVLLKNLEANRQFFQNEVKIHRDTTHAMPDREQEMILNAMNGPIPRGYEEALKSYYQAIAKEE